MTTISSSAIMPSNFLAQQVTSQPERLASGTPLQRAQAAAENLESVFIKTMVDEMFSGLKTDGPFGGGYAEETFRGLLSEQYAKSIAASGGIGLADSILADLLAAQEQSQQ